MTFDANYGNLDMTINVRNIISQMASSNMLDGTQSSFRVTSNCYFVQGPTLSKTPVKLSNINMECALFLLICLIYRLNSVYDGRVEQW